MIEPKTVRGDTPPEVQPDARGLLQRCAEWLAAETEQDQLTRRWAELETQLERQHGWLRLSLAERRAIPEAAEMFRLEASLDRLTHHNDDVLESIAKLKADNLVAVTAKLAIVARLLRDDDGPAHRIVAEVVRALATRCGRAKAAAAPTAP